MPPTHCDLLYCCHRRLLSNNYPPPDFRQITLSSKSGNLSLSKSPPPIPRPARTPAPHAVRRIANTATFSTADASLTTFLRLPAEVRLQIYRLLLVTPDPIRYLICSRTHNLLRRADHGSRASIRHGLFPSILECCRLTHSEGTAFIYGENKFLLESCKVWRYRPVLERWRPGLRNMALITRLEWTSTLPHMDCAGMMLRSSTVFPSLRQLDIRITHMSRGGWEKFLCDATISQHLLKRVKKVCISITVWREHYRTVAEQKTIVSPIDWKTRLVDVFQPTWEEHQSTYSNFRHVRWECEAGADESIRSYGTMDTVRLSLE